MTKSHQQKLFSFPKLGIIFIIFIYDTMQRAGCFQLLAYWFQVAVAGILLSSSAFKISLTNLPKFSVALALLPKSSLKIFRRMNVEGGEDCTWSGLRVMIVSSVLVLFSAFCVFGGISLRTLTLTIGFTREAPSTNTRTVFGSCTTEKFSIT